MMSKKNTAENIPPQNVRKNGQFFSLSNHHEWMFQATRVLTQVVSPMYRDPRRSQATATPSQVAAVLQSTALVELGSSPVKAGKRNNVSMHLLIACIIWTWTYYGLHTKTTNLQARLYCFEDYNFSAMQN